MSSRDRQGASHFPFRHQFDSIEGDLVRTYLASSEAGANGRSWLSSRSTTWNSLSPKMCRITRFICSLLASQTTVRPQGLPGAKNRFLISIFTVKTALVVKLVFQGVRLVTVAMKFLLPRLYSTFLFLSLTTNTTNGYDEISSLFTYYCIYSSLLHIRDIYAFIDAYNYDNHNFLWRGQVLRKDRIHLYVTKLQLYSFTIHFILISEDKNQL